MVRQCMADMARFLGLAGWCLIDSTRPDRGEAIMMDIKRTHEDADGELGLIQVITDNVRQAGAQSLLDGDYLLIGFYYAGIDYGAVGRTDDVFSRRRNPGWIAEKPDVAPIKETCRQGQGRSEKPGVQCNSLPMEGSITLTKATPEEKGKFTTSKYSFSFLMDFIHFLTPAWVSSSRM